MSTAEIMIQCEEYVKLKSQLRLLGEQKELLEASIYDALDGESSGSLTECNEGTQSFTVGNAKVKIVKKLYYSVDDTISENQDLLQWVKVKYDYSKTLPKDIDEASLKKLNKFVTTKAAKPSFDISLI